MMKNGQQLGKLERQTLLGSGILGAFLNGLTLPIWYRQLDKQFGVSRTCTRTVFSKVVADQVIYAPFSIMIFFLYSSYASESSWVSRQHYEDKITSKMKNDFFSTWLADCAFWPFVNLVTFRVMPLVFRPIFAGFAQVFWQSYMTHVGFR